MTTDGFSSGGWQFLVRWASLIALGIGLIVSEATFRRDLLDALDRIAMTQERVLVSQQTATQSLQQLLIENQTILQADRDARSERLDILDAVREIQR